MQDTSLLGGGEVAILARLLVALLTGMLIGIEREKARIGALVERKAQQRIGVEELVVKEFPGMRTFGLIALYGALVGAIYEQGLVDSLGFSILLSLMLVVIAVFTIFRLLVARLAGITTVAVMLIDFILGVIAGLGYLLIAVSIGVLTTFILAIKIPVEKVVGRISYNELLWALELGVVILVVGPFFLTSNISYYGVSLRGLYLFFALVLSSSYLGYVALRLKGAKGIAYLVLLGGFAHSEATLISTLSLIPRSDREKIAHHAAILSNSSMTARDLLIALGALAASGYASQIHSAAILLLASLMAMLPAFFSWTNLISYTKRIPEPKLGNPLRLSTALKATLVYLVIAFTAGVSAKFYGSTGLLLVSLIGGFVSSSATILTLFTMGIEPLHAATLSVYAIIAALLNKPLYAYTAVADARLTARILWAVLVQASLALIVIITYGIIYGHHLA